VRAQPGPRTAFWTLVAFMAFSSFAFGCMEGWAIATCELILFFGAARAGWLDRNFWRWPRRLWPPALLVIVLIAVGLIQLVPLPVSWWRAAHAERAAVYDEGAQAETLLRSEGYRRHPFAPDAGTPLPPDTSPMLTPEAPAWLPASFTPMDTARAVVALCAGLCLMLLLECLAVNLELLRRLILIAGLLGLAVAAVALVQYAEKKTALLWIRPSPWADRAFGPFVNANHGEAFVNLTFPCLYYLLWRISQHERKGWNRWGIRVLMAGIFGFHVVLLAVSHSHAAFLALALYPIAAALHFGWRGRRWAAWAGYVGGATLALAVVAVAWLGLLTDHGRWPLLKNVPFQHMLLGQGLGSFEARFPAVITDYPLTFTTKVNTHLENEYGQVFFEGGALPAILSLVAAAWVFRLSLRGIRWGHACFWMAPALISETAHAAVDFTGHVFPVVGAFLLLCIVVARHDTDDNHRAESHRARSDGHERTGLEPKSTTEVESPFLIEPVIGGQP
jgi:hypothetical protein